MLSRTRLVSLHDVLPWSFCASGLPHLYTYISSTLTPHPDVTFGLAFVGLCAMRRWMTRLRNSRDSSTATEEGHGAGARATAEHALPARDAGQHARVRELQRGEHGRDEEGGGRTQGHPRQAVRISSLPFCIPLSASSPTFTGLRCGPGADPSKGSTGQCPISRSRHSLRTKSRRRSRPAHMRVSISTRYVVHGTCIASGSCSG